MPYTFCSFRNSRDYGNKLRLTRNAGCNYVLRVAIRNLHVTYRTLVAQVKLMTKRRIMWNDHGTCTCTYLSDDNMQ